MIRIKAEKWEEFKKKAEDFGLEKRFGDYTDSRIIIAEEDRIIRHYNITYYGKGYLPFGNLIFNLIEQGFVEKFIMEKDNDD